MPATSMIFGVLMTLEGLGLYVLAIYRHLHMEPKGDAPSPTALIPAAFGIILVVLGLIARRGDRARMHAMHFAAMVGLIGVIVPAWRVAKGVLEGKEWGLAMTGSAIFVALSGVFLALCINSFIQARRQRKAREHGNPPGTV